jgi:hypothetical protein
MSLLSEDMIKQEPPIKVQLSFWDAVLDRICFVEAYLVLIIVVGCFVWSIVSKWTSPQIAFQYFADLFYVCAWPIAGVSGFCLFGPAQKTFGSIWKTICLIALVAAIGCIAVAFVEGVDIPPAATWNTVCTVRSGSKTIPNKP